MVAIITIQTMGKGQGWAKEGTAGAAEAQDTTCLKPLGIFLSFAYFLSTKCLFALRTTSMMMTNHHHTPSPSPEQMRLKTHLHLKF